jgi:tetratricopeptide (TPR) repeat protein
MTTGRRAGGKMLNRTAERIEELRQQGLALVRENRLEEALSLYDQALALTDDEETSELIRINKADAMIGLERTGPEILELPRVIMRRRNPRHVCLAAYALQYKHRLENDLKRALFYGELALSAADQANDLAFKRAVLIDLGNVYEMDSQIARAIDCFQQALGHAEGADAATLRLIRGYATENLGYCHLLEGNLDDGIALIHAALQHINDPLGLAEAYIDLCYGYLESEQLEQARFYGESGLEVATEERQIRNAHYLLGEVAYKLGDTDAAERHFDELAKFYPQFRNLKSLLFAIDLRSMVNLKL